MRFRALGTAAFGAALFASGAAHAVQINVNGFCTIEMAFETADTLQPVGGCEVGTGTGDVIQLTGGSYTVTQHLVISQPLTVRGDGSGLTVIRPESMSADELFWVYNGSSQSLMDVTFQQVTLDGSDPSNSQVTGIWAPRGGDPNLALSVHVINSTVQNFTWAGVWVEDAAFSSDNSTFQFNSSPNNGGGLYLIQHDDYPFNTGFFIRTSAVIGNHSDGDGGGVYSKVAGTASISNSTLSSNTTNGKGGGVYSENVNYLLTFQTTVAFNQATVAGGGFASGSPNSFNMSTTIVANNSGPSTSPDGYVPTGLTVALTDTLIGNTTGIGSRGNYIFHGVDLRNKNAMLDSSYFDMGGLWHTVVHRLLPGSPAIDYFDTFTGTDQRGFPVPRDGDGNGSKKVDIGAYEYDPNWQTEALILQQFTDQHVLVTSSGSDTSTSFSAGVGTNLKSNAANDFVTYAVPVRSSGNYNVRVRVRKGSNSGKVQVQWSNSTSGPWTNIGAVQDLYASSNTYTELNLNSGSPTNISSSGQKFFRFLVTGKNASSSSYQLFLDYIQLNKL